MNPRSVPISPMNPARTPVSVDAHGQLADELVGEVVGAAAVEVGRVGHFAIPARTHDDVHAAGFADPPQGGRVAAETDVRGVADGPPAGVAIATKFRRRPGPSSSMIAL